MPRALPKDPDAPRSVNETAAYLGISQPTLLALIESGDIEAFDVSTSGRRHLKITQAAIDEFIARRSLRTKVTA